MLNQSSGVLNEKSSPEVPHFGGLAMVRFEFESVGDPTREQRLAGDKQKQN